MIPCEEFESRLPFDKSIDIIEHKRNCPHCAQYSEAIASVRLSLAGSGDLSAPLGFENRLFGRLDELSAPKVHERKLLPNTLAFASGLTLALIAGFVYINNQFVPDQNGTFVVNKPLNTDMVALTADSSVQDTAQIKTESWGSYWNTEAVSTQP